MSLIRSALETLSLPLPLLVSLSLLSLQWLFFTSAAPFHLEDFPCFPVGGNAGFIYQYHNNNSSNNNNNSGSYLYQQQQRLPEVPPFVYIKTHKTGSTSMANILHRIADIRNLTVLASLQGNNSQLGWPKEFPGPFVKKHYRFHSADAIINHSILDREEMLKYMRYSSSSSNSKSSSSSNGGSIRSSRSGGSGSNVLFFTTLRDPYHQAISSYSFFAHETPWEQYFKKLKHAAALVPEGAPFSAEFARAKNSQAYDLGWYRSNNWVSATTTTPLLSLRSLLD